MMAEVRTKKIADVHPQLRQDSRINALRTIIRGSCGGADDIHGHDDVS